MKHNLLKSVILSVILLMGVSNAWGADWHLQNNASKIYFSDLTTNWVPTYANSHHIIFLMGRDDNYGQESSGSQAYDMKYLSNTRLWYYNVPKWGDGDNGRYQYIAFRYATDAWTDWKKGETVTHRATWNNSKYSMTRNDNISGKTLYYEPQSSTTNTNTNVTENLPKYTATVNFKVSRNGGSSYDVTNKKFGTITFTGTYMDGDAKTGQSSATTTGETKSNYDNIPVTGEFTLTNTALTNEAYEFVGFGTGDTPTDKVNTKTWNITGNTTYYVFYKHKLYTVTYSKGTYGSGSNQTANKLHGETLALADKGAFTRTGYTQTAWNTNTDGKSGTSYALKANYTSNQAITLYPTWTANRYTITWNANGGSVTPTPSTYTYDGDPVPLPTLTRTGYTFNGWFTAASGGTKISDVGKTNKPASNTTYYAQWTENTYTVNIVANPAEAAKTLTLGSQQVGINAVTISATPNVGYQFVNWTATDGITIANANDATTTIKATKAGTVTANFEAQPSTTIYLEPTGHWNSDNPQYVAHVWNTSGNKDIVMTGLGKSPYQYYKAEVPYGYTNVVFYRKKSDGSVLWNQTADLTLPSENKTLYEIKSTGNGTETKATGDWKEPNVTVTLEKTAYGKYAIELNGLKYYSSQTEDVIKNVPLESTLKLVSAESFNTAYNNNMCIQAHDGAAFEAIAIDANHTICGTTVIKENFSTLAAHTVYLRVSTTNNEINSNWNQSGYYNFIYCSDNIQGKVTSTVDLPEGEIYKESGYNYYKFVIPTGCRTFRFERKTAQNVAATYVTESFTRYLPFEITNCYTIEGRYINDQNTFYGSWGMSLANGDYRLLYVEQVVEKGTGGDNWKTIITRKKAHPSNIIKKGTASQIVSLHVYKERKYTANAGGGKTYESSSNPEIILQQYSNGVWVDKERHMVLGPLQTLPGMAMAPGRRNTAAATATLVYDDGIEIIKDDNEDGRVWNFTVTQDANGVATLPLDGENLVPYEGQYYIRTDNSEGGWMDYTIPGNHIHFSQYAKDNSNFSHYFCRWVEKNITPNTKFVIANDHGVAISDTLSGDQFTDIHGNIQEDANIRWSWNETTNEIARAYIQGAFGDGGAENNNILVSYTTDGSNTPEPERLEDRGDWIYSIDVNNVKVGSTLKSITATYPKTKHTIDDNVINPTTQIFEQELPMLTGGESANTYTVRVLYDFKIDKTLVALVPNNYKAEIGIDVIIERVDQGEATQVKAPINAARTAEGSTVYAVMSFTKDHLISNSKSNEEKLTYWFSLPFDVTLSDVFGFGEVGQYWMIKYYDGEERAQKGLLDDNTFWKYITKKSTVLEANKGYVLALNKKVMDSNSPIFTNTNKISLYFPSTQLIKEINTGYTQTTCTIPEYKSTLKNREIYDSNWNFIGVPSYADKNKTTTNDNVKYFYDYDHKSDSYTVAKNGGNKKFNSMFAYMVQFAGVIDWDSFDFKEGAQGLAAKRNTDSDTKQHNLRLELQQNGATADKTFIQLQDEDATEMFDMNSDLCKIINAGSNIYSIITTESTPIQVAGNIMPIQETIIPVGVVISAAGEYTFAMPEGTDGIVVELIDYENNTRTNMLLDNYTVNLGKGTFDNRFALHVKPDKTTTSVDNIGNEATGDKVKKYLIDGILYMQKDGVLYDAQGKLVR